MEGHMSEIEEKSDNFSSIECMEGGIGMSDRAELSLI